MTVAQLVKELKKWPQNAEIVRLEEPDKLDCLYLLSELQSLGLYRNIEIEAESKAEVPVVLVFTKMFIGRS